MRIPPQAIETFNRQITDPYLIAEALRRDGPLSMDERRFLHTVADRLEKRNLDFLLESRCHEEGSAVASVLFTHWVHALNRKRPEVLRDWLLPHVTGTTLDLLCGTTYVGRALEGADVAVTYCERPNHYLGTDYRHVRRFVPYDALTTDEKYDTVLLIAVLHHEADPLVLLQQASEIATRRIVVVENCIEGEFTLDVHTLWDYYFSSYLDNWGEGIPIQHRTPEAWEAELQHYGTIIHRDYRKLLPGVPLPHHLWVVER